MNGSLTLLDDNLLYIAFSIIGLSGKNEQKMKFRGRGVGQRPNRSLNHDDVYIEDCKGEGQQKCVFCESRLLHFVHCNWKRRILSVIHTLTPDREI